MQGTLGQGIQFAGLDVGFELPIQHIIIESRTHEETVPSGHGSWLSRCGIWLFRKT
jgi:hypothetical protein